VSERIIPHEDNFQRTKDSLIHEIELIHHRERAAAETCNRYRLEVAGLKETLKQQYALYQAAIQEQADITRRFADLQKTFDYQVKEKIESELDPIEERLAQLIVKYNLLRANIFSRMSRKDLREETGPHEYL